MPQTAAERNALYYFANALRGFLRLDPIYEDGAPRGHRTVETRFGSVTHEW